jgi:phosphatidylglycerophosphate synthase
VTATDRDAPLPPLGLGPEDPWTWPNRISLIRTVLALAVGAVAATERSLALLAVAYAVYWVGDVLDGWVARRTGTETRQGAVLDILCDRACCSLCVAALLVLRPDMTVPLVALAPHLVIG